MIVRHRIAERFGQRHRDFPVGLARLRRHHLAHARNAPLGIGEGAILFEERRTRQKNVRVLGSFIQEQILHYHAFHRCQRGGDVLGIRIRLHDIFAFTVQSEEAAIERRFKHVGNPQTRLRIERHAPGMFEF